MLFMDRCNNNKNNNNNNINNNNVFGFYRQINHYTARLTVKTKTMRRDRLIRNYID